MGPRFEFVSPDEDVGNVPIPRDVAIRICTEIRAEKEHKLFSQCWGCVKFSKGAFDKMCAAGSSDYRGCTLVNARYDREVRQRRCA